MTVGGVGRTDMLYAMSYAQRGGAAEGTPGEEAGESSAVEQGETAARQTRVPAASSTAVSSPATGTHKVDLLA